MNARETPMLDTIMVALDGSEFARHAVPRAVDVARRAGADLLLVRVHRGFPPADPDEAPASLVEADRELEAREREELEAAAEEIRGEGVEVATSFEAGPVAESLARRAEAEADLVVMSTHGREGMSRFWLGSVADGVVRSCPVPLFLVRPHEDGETARPAAPELDHVLVALDGSRVGRRALDPASIIGGLYEARFTLMRVIEPVVLPGYRYADLPDGVDTEALEALEEMAGDQLEADAARLRDRGLRVEVEIVRDPSVPEGLLEAVDRLGADLMALATRGQGGLKRMLLGSVADKVLRGTEGPLLVVNPADGE